MINKYSNTCLICEEEIHTKMCENCLSESMIQWADVKSQALKQKKFERLKKYLEVYIDNKKEKETSCVSCNKKKLEVCPACFARLIQEKMNDLGIEKQTINEFKQTFWFDGKEIITSNSVKGKLERRA